MTKMMTQHQNSEGLAKGLLPYIETALPTATCRPYNRFESQETEWLLSPVRGEVPLYRPSKYYTVMNRADDPTDSQLLAGLYVEKGFTGDAAKMGKVNERMDASWGWHDVMKGFCSGKLSAVLEAMPSALRQQTEIQVSGGYPEDTYGSYQIHRPERGKGSPLTVDIETPVPHLAVIGSVSSWDDLAAALTTITANDWLWIDLYIYVRLGVAPRTAKAGKTMLTDQQLWNGFLEPLLPWITVK